MSWYIFKTGIQVSLSCMDSWLLGGTVWYSTWNRSLNHTWLRATPVASAHPWELEALYTFEDVPSGHQYFVTKPLVPLKFLSHFSLGFCNCTMDSPFLPSL